LIDKRCNNHRRIVAYGVLNCATRTPGPKNLSHAKKGAKVFDLDEATVERWRAIARDTAWKDYAQKTRLSAELLKLAEGIPLS
jgi:hypothetical protein